MKNGFLITFEGIDNSGKTVQAKAFFEKLGNRGIDAIFLRDPGTTRISERIRSILLDNELKEMSPWTELLLYEAARAQMIEEMMLPALEEGKIVICDRLYDSTTAYQGYGRGLDLDLVVQANKLGSRGLVPDLTFLLDVEPETALSRLERAGFLADRLEAEGLAFQSKIRDAYLQIARKEKKRIFIVEGNRSISDIQNEIWQIFLTHYKHIINF